jgi:hypothetical protein
MQRTLLNLLALAWLAVLTQPRPAFACATCYGVSDSNLARGMNWGILSLLFVVLVVLSGVGSFFLYLARRSAVLNASKPVVDPADSVEAAPEQVESFNSPAQ